MDRLEIEKIFEELYQRKKVEELLEQSKRDRDRLLLEAYITQGTYEIWKD